MYNFNENISNSTLQMGDYMECPLHWLVTSDAYYLEFKARLEDPNARDYEGNTFLHVAAQSQVNNSRIVRLLLDRGADVDSTNPDGHTPLHFAVASRKRDTVAVLIEAGASVNTQDSFGRTALHFSVCKEHSYRPNPVSIIDCDMRIVERLLCHPKTCLNPIDPTGETPLMWAVKERNFPAVRALLKNGANPDLPQILDNRTALHEALYAQNPNIIIVSALLAYGAGIYCEDILRKTPVDILVQNVSVYGDVALRFAKDALMLIAFGYHIRDCVWPKLEKIPDLYNFFNECCKEVRLMKKLIIYDDITLHDFCLNCFQIDYRFVDPVTEIYTPAVEMLLSDLFQKYYDFIYCRFSKPDLRSVLEATAGRSFALDLVSNDASKESIFYVIRRVYSCRVELKSRLRSFKHLC